MASRRSRSTRAYCIWIIRPIFAFCAAKMVNMAAVSDTNSRNSTRLKRGPMPYLTIVKAAPTRIASARFTPVSVALM